MTQASTPQAETKMFANTRLGGLLFFLTDKKCLVYTPLPIKLTYLTIGDMGFIHK